MCLKYVFDCRCCRNETVYGWGVCKAVRPAQHGSTISPDHGVAVVSLGHPKEMCKNANCQTQAPSTKLSPTHLKKLVEILNRGADGTPAQLWNAKLYPELTDFASELKLPVQNDEKWEMSTTTLIDAFDAPLSPPNSTASSLHFFVPAFIEPQPRASDAVRVRSLSEGASLDSEETPPPGMPQGIQTHVRRETLSRLHRLTGEVPLEPLLSWGQAQANANKIGILAGKGFIPRSQGIEVNGTGTDSLEAAGLNFIAPRGLSTPPPRASSAGWWDPWSLDSTPQHALKEKPDYRPESQSTSETIEDGYARRRTEIARLTNGVGLAKLTGEGKIEALECYAQSQHTGEDIRGVFAKRAAARTAAGRDRSRAGMHDLAMDISKDKQKEAAAALERSFAPIPIVFGTAPPAITDSIDFSNGSPSRKIWNGRKVSIPMTTRPPVETLEPPIGHGRQLSAEAPTFVPQLSPILKDIGVFETIPEHPAGTFLAAGATLSWDDNMVNDLVGPPATVNSPWGESLFHQQLQFHSNAFLPAPVQHFVQTPFHPPGNMPNVPRRISLGHSPLQHPGRYSIAMPHAMRNDLVIQRQQAAIEKAKAFREDQAVARRQEAQANARRHERGIQRSREWSRQRVMRNGEFFSRVN